MKKSWRCDRLRGNWFIIMMINHSSIIIMMMLLLLSPSAPSYRLHHIVKQQEWNHVLPISNTTIQQYNNTTSQHHNQQCDDDAAFGSNYYNHTHQLINMSPSTPSYRQATRMIIIVAMATTWCYYILWPWPPQGQSTKIVLEQCGLWPRVRHWSLDVLCWMFVGCEMRCHQ